MSKVGIVRVSKGQYQWQIEEAVEKAVRKVVDLTGGLNDIVKPGALVIIKPNLVMTPEHPRCGACTSPEVCKALANIVADLGARPVIAESSAVGVDTEDVIKFMGYDRLREEGYEVIDLKGTPTVRLEVEEGLVLKDVRTYELVTEADAIISVPVMKTHDQCEVTLSLKNMKGLEVDRDKKWMHKVGVNAGVSDINSVFKPAYAVIDAIWTQEGLGPMYGIPVQMDLLIAGRDLVAVDTVGAKIMGFDPDEVPVIKTAEGCGLGTADLSEIEVVGKQISEVSRRFLRVIEDERLQMEEAPLVVHAEGTCTGCRLGVGSTLWDMKNEGILHYASGYTIVTGEAEIPEGVSPEKLIVVGNCCSAELKRYANWVRGCPPNNVNIKQALVGDRLQVTATYGEDTATSTYVPEEKD
jgi:uncharacterized protein (DUF362 family)